MKSTVQVVVCMVSPWLRHFNGILVFCYLQNVIVVQSASGNQQIPLSTINVGPEASSLVGQTMFIQATPGQMNQQIISAPAPAPAAMPAPLSPPPYEPEPPKAACKYKLHL